MGFLSWIIFGALAGWVASKITGAGERRGCLFNVVVGVVGAFVGGLIMHFITGDPFGFGFNLRSFLVAVLGSVVLLVLVGAARR